MEQERKGREGKGQKGQRRNRGRKEQERGEQEGGGTGERGAGGGRDRREGEWQEGGRGRREGEGQERRVMAGERGEGQERGGKKQQMYNTQYPLRNMVLTGVCDKEQRWILSSWSYAKPVQWTSKVNVLGS